MKWELRKLWGNRVLLVLALGETVELFNGLLFLNFFGLPVARLHATLGMCLVLLVGGVAGAGVLFVRRSPVTAARRSAVGLSLGCHVHPRRHEGYKLLISNAALGVLALVGCIVAEFVTAKVRAPLPSALICVLVLPGLALLLSL